MNRVDTSKPREERVPLYVQVVTDPPLHGCWSVNVSPSGIGLIATPRQDAAIPHEGDQIDVELSLPETASKIRARGEVRWRHDAGGMHGRRQSVSLGVRLLRFHGSDQIQLARFLANHRLQVAVCYASSEDREVIAGALERHAQLHFAGSLTELDEVLLRGDIAAIVVLGNEERARTVIEWIASPVAEDDVLGADQPRDLAPRIITCASAPPERLVALFNAGKIFRSLSWPTSRESFEVAVLAACREHGVRIEQRRVSLALEHALLRERALAEPEPAVAGGEGALPGFQSEAMQRILGLIRLAAPHRVAVLLQGETGTGKEVLARTIHRLSERVHAPFVVQDCGALTETLLESELFGHVKGAFTGAIGDHPGLFVLADGGTIFLDEIENTTPALQSKLLRVIETGDVRPVGGAQVRHVNVRVVAASNRDLDGEVKAGRFRSDLYYRLNSFTLDVPALRERQADVLPLARHFLSAFNASLGRSASGLTRETEELLLQAEWRGNVRELRNVIERAVLLSRPGQPIGPELLPGALARGAAEPSGPAAGGSLRERMSSIERELIREALARSGGVIRRAAAALHTDPVTLGRKAKRYGLGPGRA